MTFAQILPRIVDRTIARQRIGWFDHSSDSWDMRVANARAYRIVARLRGERVTMRQAMWG